MKTLWLFLFVPLTLCAQNSKSENKRTFGLGASFQSNQFDIQLPIFVNTTNAIVPSIRAIFVQDGGFDLGTTVAYRHYYSESNARPFISPKAGLFLTLPEEGDSFIDAFVGLGLGGEYFFDDHFSVNIEAQLNLTKSDKQSSRFGNPGNINVNTATAFGATFYF